MYICDMPSIQHEGLVELVRQHPPLGMELLRHVGIFALPAEVTAVLGSEDMSDVTPRSNGRDKRKPKPQKSDDKDQSWPVYATTARKANKCPRAVLVVACWDPVEADKCRRIIATGHPGLVFVPIVIDRDTAPPLADASPYLVLFNAIIGAVDLDTEEGRALVVSAITATGAEGARFRSLCDIILGMASDAAHEHLEKLMGITYKSKFVDGWYQQGRAAGEAKGMAEGFSQGEARGEARAILRVLKSRVPAPHPCTARADRVLRRPRPARHLVRPGAHRRDRRDGLRGLSPIGHAQLPRQSRQNSLPSGSVITMKPALIGGSGS
jgi:hypothetical protein